MVAILFRPQCVDSMMVVHVYPVAENVTMMIIVPGSYCNVGHI